MRFSHTLTTDLVETLMICSYLLWQMLNWLLKRGQCTLLEGINPAEPPQICTPPSSSVHFTSWGEGGDICPLSCPPLCNTERMAGKPQAVSGNGSLAESPLGVPMLGCTPLAATPQHL